MVSILKTEPKEGIVYYNSSFKVINAMEENGKSFINDLVGSTVLVKTHGGIGTKDVTLAGGEYKGILIGVDDNVIKLEYETRKFLNGNVTVGKESILINLAYIISIEKYETK